MTGPESPTRSVPPGPLLPRDAWVPAVAAWLVARLLVGAAYVISRVLDQDGTLGERATVDLGLLAWDGSWYENIATNGYSGGEEVRFAPLLPVLGRAVGLLFGDRPALGLVVVANVAALVAGVVLIAVVRDVARMRDDAAVDEEVVWLTSFAFALWPASFVLAFAYAESLLVVASMIAYLAARRGRWWIALVAGIVAGVARPTGLALTLLLVGAVWTAWREHRRVHAAGVLACLGPAVGFGIHLVAARAAGAAWSAPVDEQSPIRGDFVNPVSRTIRGVGHLLGDERFGDGLHLPFALAAFVLLVLVVRRVGWVEGAYVGLIVVVALSADNWNSLERYVLNGFPVFVAAGLVLRGRRWGWPVLIVSGAGMVALTIVAWAGRYVP